MAKLIPPLRRVVAHLWIVACHFAGLGILHALQQPEWAAKRVDNAYSTVREEYDWKRVARTTASVYARIQAEAQLSLPGNAVWPAVLLS